MIRVTDGLGCNLVGRVKTLFRLGLNSSIGQNVLSLYGLQFANYILPLVTVPYLVRVLGPEKFGAVAFGQSLIAYFVLVVNYGFDWSATRKISVQRDDLNAVSRTATSVWAAKALLCGAGFLVLVGLMWVAPKFSEISILLLVLYGIVVGNVLFPTWLFQGLERMVAISAINFVARLLVTVGVFALIHRPADFIIYAGLLSFKWVGAGVIGVWLAYRTLKISFVPPSWTEVRQALIEGWTIFLSKGAVGLYTAGNAFILGLLTNNTVVGYYSAAEKLVKAIQLLLNPISQAVYPRFSKMATDSSANALKWGRRMLLLMSGFGLVLSIGLFVGASTIVQVMLGPDYGPSVSVVRILAFLPLIIGASNVLGVQIMLPFGRDRAFTSILAGAGLINIVLVFLLTPLWQQNGIAAAVLTTEVFVTLTMLVYLMANHLSPLGKCPLWLRFLQSSSSHGEN